jgi:Aerotolerance regulator N-terminal
MAGVTVPVIVHLWNDRRGKVVRIGSIALLETSARRLARSWRISEWWLLVLRCLMVMAAALLLAGPYFVRRAVGKGWVLVDGGGGGGSGPYRGRIDSLVKAGFELHVMEDSGNYWDGFRVADKEAAPGRVFYIFTTGLAERFSGERPATEREVHWEVYAPEDSMVQWTQARWKNRSDSVAVLVGISQGTGTKWQRKSDDATKTGWRQWSDGKGAALPGDTAVLSYKIVADGPYKADGKYIAAAMKTLQQEVWRPIEEGEGGWLFWLSDRPALASGYRHVWSYARGKEIAVETRMEGVRLMKEIGGAPVGGAWRDGYGRGVLMKEGENYRFFSRLEPDWGDLVWSGRFPVMLEELMVKREEAGAKERRMMDPGQVGPVMVRGAEIGTEEKGALERVDLGPVVWGILVILFILERIIAYRNGDRKT